VNPTTDVPPTEQFITTMRDRISTLTRTLSTWMQTQEPTLAEVEHHVVRLLKEVGASLVAGLCTLAAPAHPTSSVPCACGHAAAYQRQRTAQGTTLLGPMTFVRGYYLCAACGHGQHPLDAQLQCLPRLHWGVGLTRLGAGRAALFSAAPLSFLGLGAAPPTPEWGLMLGEERNSVFNAPHLVFIPGIAIMLTVLGFNLIGDGLRDALDPRLVNVS